MPTKQKPDGREAFLLAGLYMIYRTIALEQITIEPKISVKTISHKLDISHILVIRLRRTLIGLNLLEESQIKGYLKVYPPMKYRPKNKQIKISWLEKYDYVYIYNYIKEALKVKNGKYKPRRIIKRRSKEVKELMDYWYSFPRSIKNNQGTKTFNQSATFLQELLNGTFGENNNLSKKFLSQYDISKGWLTKKWSMREIKEGLKRLSLLSKKGYWMSNPTSYYRNLSGLLYNYYSASSLFLQVMKQPPVSRGTKPKEKHPLAEIFEDIIPIDTMQDRLRFNKYLKDIKAFHQTITFKQSNTKMISQIGTPGKFCQHYKRFIESQTWITPNVGNLKVSGKIFKRFLRDVEDQYYGAIKFGD